MQSPNKSYQENISNYTAQLQAIRKKMNLIAFLRLSCFIALATVAYYAAKEFTYFFLFACFLVLALFMALVKTYFNLKDKKLLTEQLLFINQNELDILNGRPNQFDNGNAFFSQESYYDDLDIFGEGSLYHALNRTTTEHGAITLSGFLKDPFTRKEEITSQHEAVKILSNDPGNRQLLMAYGLVQVGGKESLYAILEWLNVVPKINKSKSLRVIRWALPLYNTVGVLVYLGTDNYFPLMFGIIGSWVLVGLFAKYINGQHRLIGEKQKVLNQYAGILRIFGNINPQQSRRLKELQSISRQAHQIIKQLSALTSWFDQRLNMVVNILLNSLFAYDIQCTIALENWKEANSKDFEKYINCVGNIECLNSLSCFAYNHPEYVYPIIIENEFVIKAEQIAHPLISKNECVANDFSIGKKDKLHVVTGSNMSGKTTFLRTIGVNLLLAQCGTPVCASSFVFAPMQILSSIRVSDSLQEHTSYFMAELKKLQQIILQLQKGRPALVLIDEILRGTNSEDKTQGSEEFVKRLISYHSLSLFATHDLALS
ncbi:MAG: hypothetical protein JST13_04445, partial [Bacteroidetes bacterium]|nr:hypothetical protein [Bacteroidota bacterium]